MKSTESSIAVSQDQHRAVSIIKAGASYFAVVFAVGFVLGTVRVLGVVPILGERTAELLEAPLMLVAIFFAAGWIVRRFAIPFKIVDRASVSLIALTLLLITEFQMVLWVRGLTFEQYLESRDPVVGGLYLFMLGLFAMMPLAVNPK